MPFALLQIVCLPLAAALGLLWLRPSRQRGAAWLVIGCLAYTTILLLAVGAQVYNGGALVERYPLGPAFNFDLAADGLSLPVALIVNLICLALAVYAIPYVEHRIELIYGTVDAETHGIYFRRFYLLYLFFPTGFMGVCFATNLLAIYLFMELLTIVPLYFIMAQFGYSDYITRYKVALMCLYWGVAGATLFLIGIIWGYAHLGSFEIAQLSDLSGNPQALWIAVVILTGLATKLAIVPLHVWMPWVHAEHPTCIAGLLAVYANIAAYVAVRVLIIPLQGDLQPLSLPLMIFALITMTYGALLTLAQSDAKRFCACSTISQISYSVFGVAALTTWGVRGGIFYFLSHIVGKAILFSTAGILVFQLETRKLAEMGGLWKQMPVTACLWLVAALTLSALPPTGGFVGKWMLFTGAFNGYETHFTGLLVIIAAVMSTLLTLVYTFLTGVRIFFGPQKRGALHHDPADPPLTMSLPLVLLATVAIGMGIFPDPILHMLSAVIVDW
ncbi:MAG: proton-conducting transporter membrane subunit [Desulfosarcinaceae bacterium]|nr:proton-conducting transporter membrane subunit [Desulfosarcinaceae bacterium]